MGVQAEKILTYLLIFFIEISIKIKLIVSLFRRDFEFQIKVINQFSSQRL